MTTAKIQNFHVLHMDVTSQHWSYTSEKYAGGDNLMTAIANGWEINDTVEIEHHWYAGMRCIDIFHFTITQGDQTIAMPVIGNPYVNRFVKTSALQMIDKDASPA